MKRIAFIFIIALGACGEATCPAGSIKIGSRCEPYAPVADASAVDGSAFDATAGSEGSVPPTPDSGGSVPPAPDSAVEDAGECQLDLDCPAARPRCDSGQCVGCVDHGDCALPGAPACKQDQQCGLCNSDDACAGRAGTERCQNRLGASNFGQCIQCTGDTEAIDCGDHACKRSTGECTASPRGSRRACQSCEADSECVEGARCVGHHLDGRLRGHFCFYTRDAFGGCADTVASARPYVVTLSGATSIDSPQTDTFCLPSASCQAIDDASNYVSSGHRTCDDDGDCGVAYLSDGYCGPGGRCTYACDDVDECPADLPSCKVVTDTVRYCQL